MATATANKTADKSAPTAAEQVIAEIKSLRAEMEELKKPRHTDGITPSKLFAEAKGSDGASTFGFKSLGHQLIAIKDAAVGRASDDTLKQLRAVGETVTKAATGMGEAVGPDGGFLIVPQFVEGVLEITHQIPGLFERYDRYEMTSPNMRIRAVDETSP